MIDKFEDRIVVKYARFLLHIDTEKQFIFED